MTDPPAGELRASMIVVRALIAILFACVCWHVGEAAEKTVVGVIGGSIVLNCDIERSDPPVVSWVDWVFNHGHEAQPIFSSDSGMDDSHLYRKNLSVSLDDFSLTISRLQERCAGKYICSSVVDGKTLHQSYNLVVRGIPRCRGDSQLMSGESTKLLCELPYSGTSSPTSRWTRDDVPVPSVDESGFGEDSLLSASSVTLEAVGPDDDKAVYRCEMTVADVVVHRYSVTLDVAYGAMDAKFTPNETTLVAGDELRCSARGNPSPEIRLSPAALVKAEKSGPGWRSLVVQGDWVGRSLTVECTATNVVDGVEFSPSASVTFVTEEAPAQESKAFSSMAIIAIAVVAGLLLVAGIIAIIILCLRGRSKKPPKGSKPIPTKDESAMEHRGTNGQTATA